MIDDPIVRKDFKIFMMERRRVANRGQTDFLAIKEAFFAGWEMGFYEHQKMSMHVNLILMGILFMVLGYALHF